MEHPAGKAPDADFRLGFDRLLKLEWHGSRVAFDAGLLAFRELDDALGLTELAGQALADTRSVFGHLAGYEDMNNAGRLAHDPAMRWVAGGRAVTGQAASASQIGRFETEVLT